MTPPLGKDATSLPSAETGRRLHICSKFKCLQWGNLAANYRRHREKIADAGVVFPGLSDLALRARRRGPPADVEALCARSI